MNNESRKTTPEYLKNLYSFIMKVSVKVLKGKHYKKYRFINCQKQEFSNEPEGAGKNQYNYFVNESGPFNPDLVEKIRKRFEFIVFNIYEEELGKGAFEKWCQDKDKSPEKNNAPSKTKKINNVAVTKIEDSEEIEIKITSDSFAFDKINLGYQYSWRLALTAIIQNFGNMPIAFEECKISFNCSRITDTVGKFQFNLKECKIEEKVFDVRYDEKILKPFIVNGKEIKLVNFIFESTPVSEGIIDLLKPSLTEGGPYSIQVELLSINEVIYKSNEIFENY